MAWRSIVTIVKKNIGPFIGGLLLALGLGVSGMTEPIKIIGFLNIFGNWDYSLLLVMLGAIATHSVLYRIIVKRPAPLFSAKFYLPERRQIDKKLLIGSAIFGLGWGITGLCPGPGLTALVTFNPYTIIFVLCMIVGMICAQGIEKGLSRKNLK